MAEDCAAVNQSLQSRPSTTNSCELNNSDNIFQATVGLGLRQRRVPNSLSEAMDTPLISLDDSKLVLNLLNGLEQENNVQPHFSPETRIAGVDFAAAAPIKNSAQNRIQNYAVEHEQDVVSSLEHNINAIEDADASLFDVDDTDPLLAEAERLLDRKPVINGALSATRSSLIQQPQSKPTKNVKFAPVLHNIHTFEVEEDVDVQLSVPKSSTSDEGSWVIALQVFFPFLVAGFGTVGAGLVLDKVQHWTVFTEISELFILVPALLGLKGNLEMTLASRLSTIAHLGYLDTRREMLRHIVGNLALIQAQAAVVAFLASVFALILGWIPRGEFVFEHAILLCGSSLATASLASLILSAVMIVVIIVARYLNVNPDNVATPIAASLGDLTTLGLLALIGTVLNHMKSQHWVCLLVIAVFLLLVPLWCWISVKNNHTKAVLENGWSPVIFSMLISSAGGFILDISVSKFHGIAVFQPVINGIGGNLVAVQASRLSTSLHRTCSLGEVSPTFPKNCPNLLTTYFGPSVHSRAARVLLLLVVPGHVIFMFMISFLKAGHTLITPLFIGIYLCAAVLQVSLLLYICTWMVHFMWTRKIDPDNSAIPYLTALGDLLGTALLAIVFEVLTVFDPSAHIGE